MVQMVQYIHFPQVTALWLSGFLLSLAGPGVPLTASLAVAQVAHQNQQQQSLQARAQALQTQGEYAQAEVLWRQALQQGPATAALYYSLGVSLHGQLKLAEAIRAYQQATRLDAGYAPAYLNQGLAWIEVRNYQQASQAFRKVLALPNQASDPASTHTLAHYDLAVIFKRQDQPEAARKAAQQALSLTPGFAGAQQALSLTPGFAPAQQLLQELAQNSPKPTLP